jgi:hypothetical protein
VFDLDTAAPTCLTNKTISAEPYLSKTLAMRLLERKPNGELVLREFIGSNLPAYAILSHTWGADGEEVSYQDMEAGKSKVKTGYGKIQFCARQATADGLRYFWVDTCCIDKKNAVELSEAINSMFRWYQKAARCYVYLPDVSVPDHVGNDHRSRLSWEPAFRQSRWFTRGWTLQELIASTTVEFFTLEGKRFGSKLSLGSLIHEITGIAEKALTGGALSDFSVEERMSWAAQRNTKLEEDEFYSLLGIFDISMSPIYGEGRAKASRRVYEEIEKSSKGR